MKMKTALLNMVSVVVTVFDETYSITETVQRLIDHNRGYIKEIILLIHPKSPKETFKICRKLSQTHKFVIIQVQKTIPGVGWAIREGMEAAKGDYVALLSSDLETEPEALDRMIDQIEETDCDLVIGNRWLKGGGFYNYNKTKLVLNWLFQYIFRILYLTKLGDLTYGYKVLKRELVEKINWESTLHEIYIETTIKPLKVGCKAGQIPTVWIGRTEGESKNTFMRNFRYVRLALKVWLNNKNYCLKDHPL
jgi:dolichol-phosphate mannosyltransferase